MDTISIFKHTFNNIIYLYQSYNSYFNGQYFYFQKQEVNIGRLESSQC